jgi:superfamily II DNA or RNA helicase
VFTVDLFNEGIDVPTVDTLLLLRPTDSPTLFLQQLGRGLRRAHGKTICTVLDFVGLHRKEFRFDRRFRALLGGSRKDVERQVEQAFPFLPAGCHLELDSVAQEVVLRSIRESIPTAWQDRCAELRTLGDVTLAEYLLKTGLELGDIYAGNHSWSEMRRAAGQPTADPGPDEAALLRAVGRMLHVDDDERIEAYERYVGEAEPPEHAALPTRDARLLRMLVASITRHRPSVPIQEAIDRVWDHPPEHLADRRLVGRRVAD